MARCQCKNTINNSKDNMSLLEFNNLITEGTEYPNIAKAKEKELKIIFMKMTESFKKK